MSGFYTQNLYSPYWRNEYTLGCNGCGLGDNGDGGDFGDGGGDGGGGFGGGITPFVDTSGLDIGAGPVNSVSTSPESDVQDLGGGTYYDFTTGTVWDSSGNEYLANGSYITPEGTQVFPNGDTIFSDGTLITASGITYPPGSAEADAAAASAQASGGGPKGGGASGGSSGPKGGGSSSSNPLQQLVCALNPSASGCPQSAVRPGTPAAAASGSGISGFLNQYGVWILAFAGVAIVLPALLPDGKGR